MILFSRLDPSYLRATVQYVSSVGRDPVQLLISGHEVPPGIIALTAEYLRTTDAYWIVTMNGLSRQQSFEDARKAIENSHAGTGKRRSEDGHPSRAKRNRYVSIACSECKRRKIKCNGETPCQRCGNLSLECLYIPNCCSGGFKDSE